MKTWPSYLRRETLAKRLDIAPEYVDQLRKRGQLPEPILLGEVELYRWEAVETWLQEGAGHADLGAVDPYLEALDGQAAEVTASRPARER